MTHSFPYFKPIKKLNLNCYPDSGSGGVAQQAVKQSQERCDMGLRSNVVQTWQTSSPSIVILAVWLNLGKKAIVIFWKPPNSQWPCLKFSFFHKVAVQYKVYAVIICTYRFNPSVAVETINYRWAMHWFLWAYKCR